MIIFGSIAIALIVALILIFFFKDRVVWWELVLLIVIPTAISFGSKAIVESVSAQFTEYWGDEVISVWEEEPYNEWISQTCTREYACGTDSKGNTQYCTEPYDCSYQNDEGPEWYAKTKLGVIISISEKKYDKWNIQFGGNRIKTRTRNNYAIRDRCSYSSGTKFQGKQVGKHSYVWKTVWNGDYKTQIPVTTKHSYENRIKASDYTVFNYIEVSEEKADSLKLYNYPELKDKFNYPSVLGIKNQRIQKIWQKINAKIGYDKQIRIWVLIHKTDDEEIGYQQECYWVGGNKNELVINLGVDSSGKIIWSHIFTWSNSAGMVDNIKQYINKGDRYINEKDMADIANYTTTEVNKHWERLEFTQFDYLEVEPPLYAIILAYVFSLLISGGIAYYVITNEFDANGKINRR